MKNYVLLVSFFLTIGTVFAKESNNLVNNSTGWQGNSNAEQVANSTNPSLVKFKLVPSKGRYKFRAIVYQIIDAPKAGKYTFSFKFRREEPSMLLIPSCRIFEDKRKSRFDYKLIKKNNYPQEGEWASITKTFEVPANTPKVYFVLEARNQTDSVFWVKDPKIIYKAD